MVRLRFSRSPVSTEILVPYYQHVWHKWILRDIHQQVENLYGQPNITTLIVLERATKLDLIGFNPSEL